MPEAPPFASSRIHTLLAQRPSKPAFEVRMKAPRVAEMLIYDDIGEWGISAREFVKELRALKDIDQLDLRINSRGGDVFDGVAIANQIQSHPANVTVHIDSLCASIATAIACAANQVIMAESGDYMIHRAWTLMVGNQDDVADVLARLKAMDQKLVNIYQARTGMPEDEIDSLMANESWFTAEQALQLGFVDEVQEMQRMAASCECPWIMKPPEKNRRAQLEASVERMQQRISRL